MPDYLSDAVSARQIPNVPASYSQDEVITISLHARAEGFKEGFAKAIQVLKEASSE